MVATLPAPATLQTTPRTCPVKPMPALKAVLKEIFPLHRTLVSDGLDRSLAIVKNYMPAASDFQIETYPPGRRVWTWQVPERYVVHEAYLSIIGGPRVVDFADNPLHLVSYSLPIDQVLTWEALQPHLHFSEKRPAAIPWEFKYYERDWGFCLSKDLYDTLPRDAQYHAVIQSEFHNEPDQGLRVGSGLIQPDPPHRRNPGEMIVCTHVCHPYQANDDAAGVVTAIEVARRLAAEPLPTGSLGVRFLFCPETIGSIAYLAHHEALLPRLRAGIVLEMTGNQNDLILQRSRQDNHLIDRIAMQALTNGTASFREGAFGQVIANDERVLNGPGVNIPTISLSRWPYDEYHTTDDNLDIIFEDRLQEAADIVEETIRIYASNYVPHRNFRGPVFLSGHGLWVDWRENWALNRAIEQIMMRFEGHHSVFEIAAELGLDYWETRAYVERFREKGLVDARPLPKNGIVSG